MSLFILKEMLEEEVGRKENALLLYNDRLKELSYHSSLQKKKIKNVEYAYVRKKTDGGDIKLCYLGKLDSLNDETVNNIKRDNSEREFLKKRISETEEDIWKLKKMVKIC